VSSVVLQAWAFTEQLLPQACLKSRSLTSRTMRGIGHGGSAPSIAVFLAAFPEAGVVVAIQANTGYGDPVKTVVAALRDAAQP
jgi:hypothetical protein